MMGQRSLPPEPLHLIKVDITQAYVTLSMIEQRGKYFKVKSNNRHYIIFPIILHERYFFAIKSDHDRNLGLNYTDNFGKFRL